ncbi:MAG TPA: hypothetical protein VJX66_00555 [Amycolatopsis sp.]|nr:hypothetical protein [Amycolatopsis sp.]
MSVQAAALAPASRSILVRPGIRRARMISGAALLALIPLGLIAFLAAGWPPIVLAVPAAVPVLLVPVFRGFRTASAKIDAIFAEELRDSTSG